MIGPGRVDRAVMNLINVAGKVGFIAYLMFPISMLPYGLFALFQPCCVGCVPECVRAMFSESGFDQSRHHRAVKYGCSEDDWT